MYYLAHIPKEYKITDISSILYIIKLWTYHAHKNLYSHIVIERIWFIEFKKEDRKILSSFSINNKLYPFMQRPQEEIANIFRQKLFVWKL